MKGLKINMKEFKIPVTISEVEINADIITALEGGINYWAEIDESKNSWIKTVKGKSFSEKFSYGLIHGGIASISDVEDNSQQHELTLEKLLKGYELYFDTQREGITPQLEIMNRDAEHADAIFQLAIFGDIVYG